MAHQDSFLKSPYIAISLYKLNLNPLEAPTSGCLSHLA
jgi:hypothetical protein